MSQFPRMLYRAPGSTLLHGAHVDYCIVSDGYELAEAEAEGWHPTPTRAHEAHVAASEPAQSEHPLAALVAAENAIVPDEPLGVGLAPSPEPEPVPADDAPPTRAELEQKARELGIAFDGRTKNGKLLAKIDAALKARA